MGVVAAANDLAVADFSAEMVSSAERFPGDGGPVEVQAPGAILDFIQDGGKRHRRGERLRYARAGRADLCSGGE